MRFVNSSQRALFRHPNEAFLYDLDGTLTGTGVVENYTLGGKVRGSSLVGTSVLLPAQCTPTSLASGGTGGSICTGVIFRRLWFKITSPALWVGKALCVRTPGIGFLDRCQSLQARCSCLPYLKKAWMGNVFLAAEGQRYSLKVIFRQHYILSTWLAGPSLAFRLPILLRLFVDFAQMDLEQWELADPTGWQLQVLLLCQVCLLLADFRALRFDHWDIMMATHNYLPQVWDAQPRERFHVTHRFLQWSVSDSWKRPLYRADMGAGQAYPTNYFYNTTACSQFTGCGQINAVPGYPYLDTDVMAVYNGGLVSPGSVPIPQDGSRTWTVLPDGDGSGALVTLLAQGGSAASHVAFPVTIWPCPTAGCWPPPQAPPTTVENTVSMWSDGDTWAGTLDHPANPLNILGSVPGPKGQIRVVVVSSQNWTTKTPSQGSDVWIPPWKKVRPSPDLTFTNRLWEEAGDRSRRAGVESKREREKRGGMGAGLTL